MAKMKNELKIHKTMRIAKSLYDKITNAAAKNKKTFTDEATDRLLKSFKK